MTDRDLRTSILCMVIAMVGIVASAWTVQHVTPEKPSPSPAQLTV
jgi:hypothetical protein